MEFERDVLVSPTTEVPVIEGQVVTAIRTLAGRGVGKKAIAREVGVAINTVRRYLRQPITPGHQVRPAARRLTDDRSGEARTLYEGAAAGNAVVVQRLLAERGCPMSVRTIERAVTDIRRAQRQRSKNRVLVSLETHDRRFTGRPVAALIGDRHPLCEVLLEGTEGVEGLIGQRIALDVFDARFGLAFGPRAIRRARTRLDVPVPTEGEVGRVEADGARRAIATEHQRARIVAQQRPGHAAEMREGRGDALPPIVSSLIEKRFDEEAA